MPPKGLDLALLDRQERPASALPYSPIGGALYTAGVKGINVHTLASSARPKTGLKMEKT